MNTLIPFSSLLPHISPVSLPPLSISEISFEDLGEVACVCEGRRRGWSRWWKEFSLSTRQPGSKLFIALVVERRPAHMGLKESLTNRMVQLILLFVNTLHLQSSEMWTEGQWKEDYSTEHDWSGSAYPRTGAALTPLPNSLCTSTMLLKKMDFVEKSILEKARADAHRNWCLLRIQKYFI